MLPKQQDGVEESSGFLVSGATPAKKTAKENGVWIPRKIRNPILVRML